MQTTREGVGVEGCSHPESRTSLPVSYLFIYVGCAENQTQSLMPARQALCHRASSPAFFFSFLSPGLIYPRLALNMRLVGTPGLWGARVEALGSVHTRQQVLDQLSRNPCLSFTKWPRRP